MIVPSVRELKETHPSKAVSEINPQQTELLQDVLASKGVNPYAVAALASNNVIGKLIDTYFLGNQGGHLYPEDKTAKQAAKHLTGMALVAAAGVAEGANGTYTGTPEENEAIVKGNYRTFDNHDRPGNALRDLRRNGANRSFRSGLVEVSKADEALEATFAPIAIVGGGPAGILTGRALRAAGFRNITVFDSAGKVGGIWNRSNVVRGTKNNPFTITYDSNSMDPPGVASHRGSDYMMNAGRIGGSGRDVAMFVSRVHDGFNYQTFKQSPRLRVMQGHVKAIEPGDLNHKLTIVSGGREEKREFPIVIYAPGVGEPMPISDPTRMETPNRSKEAGRRWQQQLSEEELKKLAGQKVVLIGLGNSTAEMLFQFQNFEDKTGTSIDYKVLTHYPDNALQTPRQPINGFGSIFRDTSQPNLVKFAGDLKHIEALYWRAMHQGKIVSDATRWVHNEGQCHITMRSGEQMKFPADRLYTLIGYRQRPGVLKQMGIQVIDEDLGIGAYDFDGEVQQVPGESGRERLHPGFFAIGPIMKTPYNPNAMVIPGIQYQLNDLLTTVSMRVAEYVLRDAGRAPIKAAKRAYFAHTL